MSFGEKVRRLHSYVQFVVPRSQENRCFTVALFLYLLYGNTVQKAITLPKQNLT